MTREPGDLVLPDLSGAPDAWHQVEMLLPGHDPDAALADVLSGLRAMDRAEPPRTERTQLDRVRAASETKTCLLGGMHAVMSDVAMPLSCAREPLAITELMDVIEARWSAPAAARGLALELFYRPRTIGTVMTDPISIERILSHLVGNAAVHATRGPITLTVRPSPSGGPVFTVTDAGPGLPSGLVDHPAIFEAAQGGEAQGRLQGRAQGALGLDITRDLARRLGAALTLENRAGGGTEARLALPAQALPVVRTVEAMPDLGGLHVFLIERSASQRQAITALLTDLGARVTATGNPDLAMPVGGVDAIVVDGTVMCTDRLRRLYHDGRACPGVLALTAQTDPAGHDRLRAMGADAVLVKPCLCPVALGVAILTLPMARTGPADMARPARAIVSQAGPQAGPVAAASGAASGTSAPQAAPPTLSGSPGARRAACNPLDFDTELMQRLLILVGPEAQQDLCARILSDLEALRGGIEGTTRLPCDGEGLRRHAHGLIAIAGTCGATGLHSLAQELHRQAQSGDLPPDPTLMADLWRGLDMLMEHIANRISPFAI